MRPKPPLWSAGALTAAGLVLLVLVLARWDPLWRADQHLAQHLHRLAHAEPGLTGVVRVLSDWVWDPVTMRLVAALAVVVLLVRGAVRLAAWVATATLGGVAAQYVLKATVGRARPEWAQPVDSAHYHAFPSGHVMTATVVCAVLLVLVLRHGPRSAAVRVSAWAVALGSVAGVGYTRVHLGVHWPTDVLGGWLFGAAVAAASALPFRRGPRPAAVPAPGGPARTGAARGAGG
ncbi:MULTISPECIES: phosphatase PAP2 family protein [Streptomyces]|uniref:phosphatase PAP2 family protein n=1 Tax=Streptomyces TaxID=1883 RepID=UPI002249372D|nr:phosphatase PAP2 family protein [Streptomyces sp. JHD 1]MCX2970057.1 phosphatase PAP2 family protein [Streptomyces sp. JHD 1]